MTDINAVELGRRIRELRKDRNLSQTILAEKIGVARITVTQYELGTAKPSIEVLAKLAVTFETTTDYLLGLTEY